MYSKQRTENEKEDGYIGEEKSDKESPKRALCKGKHQRDDASLDHQRCEGHEAEREQRRGIENHRIGSGRQRHEHVEKNENPERRPNPEGGFPNPWRQN